MQKEFFLTEPFNPSPYWDNTIINLIGGQKYESNTVFPIGRYRVIVQSGGSRSTLNNTNTDIVGALISKDIIIREPFIVRAYCGEYSWYKYANNSETYKVGINPYSGSFKVNGINNVNTTPSYKNNIFGNAGSAGQATGFVYCSSGNCLGNGVRANSVPSGAGSCLHIMPVSGVFGTDYLFAFHTTGAGAPDGASGGAYGAGASGAIIGLVSAQTTLTTKNGGGTPYGTGGAGVSFTAGLVGETACVSGKDGTGIGHGFATKATKNGSSITRTQKPHGAAAFFNGTSWETVTTLPNSYQNGKIVVTYLGTIN